MAYSEGPQSSRRLRAAQYVRMAYRPTERDHLLRLAGLG